MRCLIWAAVSSKPQADDTKDSIPSQIAAARELIQRSDGWHEVAQPLTIPGHTRNYIFLSEAVTDIPQYAHLINHARERNFDLLICRGRDRLGRTDALVSQIEDYLATYGVQVYSLAMPTRVMAPDDFAHRKDRASIWLRSVERARAADELAELRARHEMGMRRRCKDGLHSGKPPYAYRKNEDGPAEICEPEAQIVRLIYRRYLQGQSTRDIGLGLQGQAHVPSARNVAHILHNPYYAGWVTYGFRNRDNYMLADGLHEAIIDRETWRLVQDERKQRERQGRKVAYSTNPLTGFVVCGYCGRRMKVDRGRSSPYRYYICRRSGCVTNSYRVDKLEGRVAGLIIRAAQHPELVKEEAERVLAEQNQDELQEIERLRAALRHKEGALAQYHADYEMGLLNRDDFYGLRMRLSEEVDALESGIDRLESRIPTIDPDRVVGSLSELVEGLGAQFQEEWAKPEKVRQVKANLRRMGLRVVVKDGEADITIGPSVLEQSYP